MVLLNILLKSLVKKVGYMYILFNCNDIGWNLQFHKQTSKIHFYQLSVFIKMFNISALNSISLNNEFNCINKNVIFT